MLNNLQFYLRKGFEQPRLDSVISFKPIVLLFLNILTVGIYGSIESVRKQFQVKKLSGHQQDLLKQIDHLNEEWKKIEEKLLNYQDQYTADQNDGVQDTLSTDLDGLSSEIDALNAKQIAEMDVQQSKIAQVAIAIFSFVGQLLANLATVGLYGVYKNHVLTNRIILLDAENTYLRDQGNSEHDGMGNKIAKQIEMLHELKRFEETDEGKLRNELKKVQKDAEATARELKNTQQSLKAVETQKAVLETTHLKTVKAKDAELAKARQQVPQGGYYSTYSTGMHPKTVTPVESAAVKLYKDLGPVPRQYKKREEDGNIAGARNLPGKTDELDPDWVAFATEYNKRYEDKRTAPEIIKEAFVHTFDSLIQLAKDGDKIHFNESSTVYEATRRAFNCDLIYTLLMGAELKKSCTQDHDEYDLFFNKFDVRMVSSEPQKVLEFKADKTGKVTPKVVSKFYRHDDFFPGEEFEKLPYGVDPVSVKWILARLTPEQHNHLLNLLRKPMIENSHPDLIATTTYMKNMTDPGVKLVDTAYQLIMDMACAIDVKFNTVLNFQWIDFACDMDLAPFQKEEDKPIEVPKENQSGTSSPSNGTIIPWTLDQEIVSAKGAHPEFYNLIAKAREKYAVVFKHLDKDILLKPKKNTQFAHSGSAELLAQFHTAHEVKFQGCLYSNILAGLVTDPSQINDENIRKLKKAMACYLDRLREVETLVKALEDGEEDDFDGIGDMDELLKQVNQNNDFKAAIKSNYGCSVEQYQKWLRNEPGGISIANINLDVFEIQLASFALNCKIGIFNIGFNNRPDPVEVDSIGKLIPQGYFGPNTAETLVVGSTSSFDQFTQRMIDATYYGFFPKIDLAKAREKGVPEEDLAVMKEIDNYWSNIGVSVIT